MSYSEEARRKAAEQVNHATGHKKYDLWGYAIGLQCRLNELEEADRWIPVEERLPEEETPVLVWFPYWCNTPFIGVFDGEIWFGERILSDEATPTHWRPLPAPPNNSSLILPSSSGVAAK